MACVWLVSRTKFSIFSLKKNAFTFQKMILLSSLQYLHTKDKAEDVRTRGRWKRLLQDQGSYSLFPPCCTFPVRQPERACHTPALGTAALSLCVQSSNFQTLLKASKVYSWLNLTCKSQKPQTWTPSCLRGRFSSPHSFQKDTTITWNQKAACKSFCTLLASKQTTLLPLRCHLNIRSSTIGWIQGRKKPEKNAQLFL